MRYALLLALLLLLPAPLLAASWWRSIAVEWAPYAAPIEPEVEAYVLYRGDNEVCRWEGVGITSASCEVVISDEKTPFGLAVMLVDGTYSPRSNIIEFTDAVNAPELIKITR